MFVSRFAPAPTGFLHLGHVLNALHVWGITRALHGRVLLRVEDHDRQRSRPEYERAMLEDLEWLGFVPDEPALSELRNGTSLARQSDRQAIYEARLSALRTKGLVYACACTRRELRNAVSAAAIARETSSRAISRTSPGWPAAAANDGELCYSGRCADRGLRWQVGIGLRVRLAPSTECFDDLRHGPQEQRPHEQCGDMLIVDRDGNWTYQFAVTVDDLEQGVNLVIRGDDLLPSTGRQIQLARLLGREEPPRFLHHALIMKSALQKLSKADRDTSILEMRHAGASVEDVCGRTLAAAGFLATDAPISRAEAEEVVSRRYADALAELKRSAASGMSSGEKRPRP